ncbi:hypothetical protein CC78DRAFT_533384 [Lojkania enalia]|uniref:Cerato-platanin n=1 Tax=Lojkania enalia TaxID=147567 RepID=A0A9P4K9D0_9PLEO|nr:hypothetical protein CC78DRAFT_533384 [Didymosphaeria enalia]
MLSTITPTLLLASAAFAAPATRRGNGVSITPHDKYSSSIGVLGCKIDTNRVAYWPGWPKCDGVCIKVTANGRSVNLLQIDASEGAHDISYDAWNYLSTGQSATENPSMGGGIDATWESAPMSDCADLLQGADGKLPLMAANSMNFYAGCPDGSWVKENSALYNIATASCTLGIDEVCHLPAVGNQPVCPSGQLGAQTKLDLGIHDIVYGTGKLMPAP